ncbi:hypothetical protein GCM10010885_13190 [Alicyclobacillus cellulosilyticus]|uniref:F5/8 type C domain-containing protein n=1 Tax=Alicyclobacillus cellulosilyticus TaxID=1003997 RepID=A0A917NJH3_9BACL|nr:DUF4855 domain-containing protein [Alicyclobacillus cellulosilyticus]GGJ05450.1 hypothetical protein GCM10010885_13190 [Alicyclobacillus cellulosilyticus]
MHTAWRHALAAFGAFFVVALTLAASAPAVRTQAAPVAAAADVDLARGRPYMITTTLPDRWLHHVEAVCFPDTGHRLTDGEIGPMDWTFHGPWVGFLRQERRDVVLDLGAVRTIHQLSAWFLQDRRGGIRFPKEVAFAVATQPGLWQTLGRVPTRIPLYAPGPVRQAFTLGDLCVAARYVRVSFTPEVWCFLSEVACIGTPSVLRGTPVAVPSLAMSVRDRGYLPASLPVLHGRRHEVLIYNGYVPRHPSVGHWTSQMFLPYVAYIDPQGHVRDWLFDTFLFLPFTCGPSGGRYAYGSATQADWRWYVDQLFTPGTQLAALDHAVATAEAALHQRGRQVSVVLAIPFPGRTDRFLAGLPLDPAQVGHPRSLAERAAVIEDYVRDVLAHWRRAHFPHLSLAGFYWLAESIPEAESPDEHRLIRLASAIVHAAGPYAFDWIPFHESEGFRTWREDGFDDVLMQPNYAFDAGPDRLANNAWLARKYGLGVEMEMDWRVLRRDPEGDAARRRYQDYLDAAYRYGYRQTLLAWYQGYQVLRAAMLSPDPAIRRIYDDTYLFVRRRHGSSHRAAHLSPYYGRTARACGYGARPRGPGRASPQTTDSAEGNQLSRRDTETC